MKKIIIAGSRGFNNYQLVKEKLDYIRSVLGDFEVLCGEARGADYLGKQYARIHKLPIASFPADWETYGKRAGYIRNEEMAKYADACLVFWNGTSNGTKHMINLAMKYQIPLFVVKYEQD